MSVTEEAPASRHDPNCGHALPDGSHSDAAKRIADWWNLHVTQGRALAYGHFIACSLADGSSDGVLYASRLAAVRHQHHNERNFMYLRILPHGMTVCDAESLLWTHRQGATTAIDAPDRDAPGGGMTLIRRISAEEDLRMRQALASRVLPLQRIG